MNGAISPQRSAISYKKQVGERVPEDPISSAAHSPAVTFGERLLAASCRLPPASAYTLYAFFANRYAVS